MNRQPYIAPSIRRITHGSANPQRLGNTPVMDAIDGVAVADLVRDHGSPLFVFSESSLREKIRSARRAFEALYPDVCFAWSYKTNYLNAVCRVFHQEGSIAEVVSGFEYQKARHNGIPGKQIIFNGPWKDDVALRVAVTEGAMIQIDHRDEMLALAKIAVELDQDISVAIRVHVETGTHAVWSKFGFNADDGEAQRIIRWMTSHTRLRLRGLHCHVGTFMLDVKAYETTASVLVELAGVAEAVGAGPIEYLNLGGGFASHARLHGQYLAPEQVTPDFNAYAKAICGTIRDQWPDGKKLPRLYLETGRALVDEAGYLISRVVAVKQRTVCDTSMVLAAYGKGGLAPTLGAYGKSGGANKSCNTRRNAVVLDAGINILYTTAWYQPTIYPAAGTISESHPTTVYGCLCMNIDVIREETPLPDMRAGDAVVIHPVGAYNITQSMQFITYRPAVVMVGTDQCVHLIRKRETLSDVQGPEVVPAHVCKVS